MDSDDPVSWRAWANRVTREHQRRLSDASEHVLYTSDDVDTLRNGLRRFSEAFTNDERSRAVGATFGSSNHVVELAEGEAMPLADVAHSSFSSREVGIGSEGAAVAAPILPATSAVIPFAVPPPPGGSSSALVVMEPTDSDSDESGPTLPLFLPPVKKGKGGAKGPRTSTAAASKSRAQEMVDKRGKGAKGGKGAGRAGAGQHPKVSGGPSNASPPPPRGQAAYKLREYDPGTARHPPPSAAPAVSSVPLVLPAGVCLTLAPVAGPLLEVGVPRVHVSVPCTVCSTSADLLSLTSMVEAG